LKDRNDFRLGIPIGDVILDELHVEDRGRQVPFELQGADTEHHLHVRQFHGNINMQRFL
jgi:heme/copper-type cytochrome/quinol oxidase subunit 2